MPAEFIAEPHKTPMALQKKLGIRIGTHLLSSKSPEPRFFQRALRSLPFLVS